MARNQQRHIAERVRAFVVNHMFCKIKFIRNDAMVHEAIKMVMDCEQVLQEQRNAFQTVYTYAFNFALNSKQAHVRQQVRSAWWMKPCPNLRRRGKLFTIEELCKLRWAETRREKEAFFWFLGTFLMSVCGARAWGSQKEQKNAKRII